MRTTLPPARYATDSTIVAGFDRVTEAIRRAPGVITASATVPRRSTAVDCISHASSSGRTSPPPPASTDTQAAWSVVRPGYFATMSVPYVPHTRRRWHALTVVVRTRTDPVTLVNSVREAIWLVDKKLPWAASRRCKT